MGPQLLAQEVKGEEDCLYVNVWRPRERSERPLPVMVWLTGGGNHSLSGQGAPGFGGVVYNGQQPVPEGILFVSYNLRVGALGFLVHPALDGERPDKVSGNYGSLDQIATLEWVHRNIAAFGRRSVAVFLFGTSAGGGNICHPYSCLKAFAKPSRLGTQSASKRILLPVRLHPRCSKPRVAAG
jgi:para-nitrobenzyl esterase